MCVSRSESVGDSEVGGKCSFRVGVGGGRHIVVYPRWGGDKLGRAIDRERFGELVGIDDTRDSDWNWLLVIVETRHIVSS